MAEFQTTPSTTDAAAEIIREMQRRFGVDLRGSVVAADWLAACIGEVRAEVVDPTVPPHRVARRWSKYQGQTP